MSGEMILGGAGVILTALGVGLTIWAIRFAKKQGKELVRQSENLDQQTTALVEVRGSLSTQLQDLKRHADSLQKIHEALSTRYLGEFPNFNERITDQISKAKKHLRIVSDTPAYGHFSAHLNWLKYKYELESKIANKDVTIELMVLDQKHRLRELKKQLSSYETIWNDWKLQPEIKERIEQFAQKESVSSLSDLSYNEFIGALSKFDDKVLCDVFSGADTRREIFVPVPLHFWVCDDLSAVFEFPSYSDGYTAYGFETSDRNIIGSLTSIYDGYKEISRPFGEDAQYQT